MPNDENKRIEELEAELERLRRAAADPQTDESAGGEEITEQDIEIQDDLESAGSDDSKPSPLARIRGLAPLALGAIGVILLAAIVGLGLLIAHLVSSGRPSPAARALEDAYEVCGPSSGLELRDNSTTLIFDHKGEEDTSGSSIEDIACVFVSLDMPSSILSHMDQTTANDGRQTEEWDDYRVQWSYHPDRGMDGIITIVQK